MGEIQERERTPNPLLKRQRDLRGWSRGHMAKELQTRFPEVAVTDKDIGRWETGKRRPGPYYREKLCVLFQTTADKLGFIPHDVSFAHNDEKGEGAQGEEKQHSCSEAPTTSPDPEKTGKDTREKVSPSVTVHFSDIPVLAQQSEVPGGIPPVVILPTPYLLGFTPVSSSHLNPSLEYRRESGRERERETTLSQTCQTDTPHDKMASSDPHRTFGDIEGSALLQPCHEKAKCDIFTFVPPSSLQSFFVTSPINRLLCIAHTDSSTPNEMTHAIQIAIQDFDTMNLDPVTRREALMTLAALPMTTLGQKQPLRVRHYEETLRQCAAALEGCWELYRGSDASGTQHAFACVCTYVPLLESIVHNDGRLRQQALDLATRYAILQTMMGWSCAKPVETLGYAQKAMTLSKETGNILLQLSAYSKLNYTCLMNKNHAEAWKAMQEGEYVLKSYQKSKKKTPLPSGIVGNFYSSYSMAQADNGIDPNTALGIATDSEPLNGHVAFIEFTTFDQWYEAARVCNSKGDPKQAMIYLGKLMDLETFASRPSVPQSEGDRVSWINTLTRALLQQEKRDMGYIIKAWTADIEGAKALKAEHKYGRATTNFEIMKVLYPGERAIMKLAPLTEHWSKQSERA